MIQDLPPEIQLKALQSITSGETALLSKSFQHLQAKRDSVGRHLAPYLPLEHEQSPMVVSSSILSPRVLKWILTVMQSHTIPPILFQRVALSGNQESLDLLSQHMKQQGKYMHIPQCPAPFIFINTTCT